MARSVNKTVFAVCGPRAVLETSQAESPNPQDVRSENVIGRAVRDIPKDVKREISAVAQSEAAVQLVADNMHALLRTALTNGDEAPT